MARIFQLAALNLSVGLCAWLMYSAAVLQHFYDTAVRVAPTERHVRERSEMRLPALYFCPADRGRAAGFQWHSYECNLNYKEEHQTCQARLQAYKGRTPDEFTARLDGGREEGVVGESGGVCLEFGTHMIGVREEWSAAWNEVTLRAAFRPPDVGGVGDALQEVELGYLPVEWEVGQREETAERNYYPLLRAPFFFLSGFEKTGVATRTFLGLEVDRGISYAGKYWYTYGAMQVAVVNATAPRMGIDGASEAYTPSERVGVVHVVLTLEDFENYVVRESSCFFPFLAALGQISGVAAVLYILLRGPAGRVARGQGRGPGGAPPVACAWDDEDSPGSAAAGPGGSGGGGAVYERVAAHDDEASGEEEQQALLRGGGSGGAAAADAAPDTGRQSSAQQLVGAKDGTDGL